MKAVVAAFNQERALVGAFSVITNLRMELFEALAQALDEDVTISSWMDMNSKQGARNYISIIYLVP